MFYEYKIKDSNKVVYIDNPNLGYGSICYELISDENFELLRNSQFVLENNWTINTDHGGRINGKIKYFSKTNNYDYLNNSSRPNQMIINQENFDAIYTHDEVFQIVKEALSDVENKLETIRKQKIVRYNTPIDEIKESKILFTLISIDTGHIFYLEAAKRLINEILNQTKHDIMISTNNVEFFSDINSSRCVIRNNIKKDSVFEYGSEFNYNLKHHAFLNIPKKYEYIIYLDCDIKLNSWKMESDFFMETEMINYDFGADRLNCHLKDEVTFYLTGLNCLFKHKISSYDILDRYTMDDDIMNSRLPSEHFFILKNDPEKIKKFQEKWEEQNYYLQNKKGVGGSWGDGFEIGISARYAGFENIMEMNPYYWSEILGFKFNGNKY